MTVRQRLLRASCLLPVLGVVLASGCEQEQGFECGRLIPGTSQVRRCDRALEVCVCATNSCAKKVGLTPDERRRLGLGGSAGAGGTGGAAGSASGGTGNAAGASGAAGASAGQGGIGGETRGLESPPESAGDGEADAWGDCPESGYRYVEGPFANDKVEHKCVPSLDIVLGGFAKKEDDWACAGQVELPVGGSAGAGGGGGLGNAGGGNGGTSSGATVVGGMSGGGNDAGAGGTAPVGEAGLSSGGVGASSAGGAETGAAAASVGGQGGGP